MSVLRFQRAAGVTSEDLVRQLPAGTFTSVSVPAPGHMIDVTVTAGGVSDATAYMASRGYTLFATDPVPTLESAAAATVPPIDRIKLNDGTVLTIGACADTLSLTRSGTTLVGAQAQFDIRDQLVFDHFITGNLDLDELGIMGWRQSISGTGADIALGGETGHPGILDIGAGTAAAGKSGIYLGEASLLSFLLGSSQNQLDMEWLVRFNAASLSSANLERFAAGWGDSWDAGDGVEQVNGIYCGFNPGVSANFRLITSSVNVRTSTDSTIAVVANTWYRIGLRVTYPGAVPTAQLFINGTLRATATANFPSAGLGMGIRMDAGASVSSEARCQADYVMVKQITAKET